MRRLECENEVRGLKAEVRAKCGGLSVNEVRGLKA